MNPIGIRSDKHRRHRPRSGLAELVENVDCASGDERNKDPIREDETRGPRDRLRVVFRRRAFRNKCEHRENIYMIPIPSSPSYHVRAVLQRCWLINGRNERNQTRAAKIGITEK